MQKSAVWGHCGQGRLGYARISDADQSNFSIPGQIEYITTHCERSDIILLDVFSDKGQSAKNFDRANWKELEAYIKKNQKNVDYLIVMKYDRFARNLVDALKMIDKIENTYKIRIVSVMEPIALHPDSPYYYQFRTQMLLGADVELRVIRDRTRFGMVSAAKSGRYISAAPVGYKNTRDAGDKPIIVIDEEKAQLIRKVFNLYTSGMPIADIKREMKGTNLLLRGNSAIQRILTNHVYGGLIKVPSYYDDPERLVKGLHDGIVSEGMFYQSQQMLSGRQQLHTGLNEAVPLRGLLQCHCGRKYTAGNSKGKTKYYWYYKCENHKTEQQSGSKIHAQLKSILQELSLSPAAVLRLKEKILVNMKDAFKANSQKKASHLKELEKINEQIDSLEFKYISNQIEFESYKKWLPKLKTQKAAIENAIAKDKSIDLDKITKSIDKITDLATIYESADVFRKQTFIKWLFGDNLSYANGVYRTPHILKMFAHKALILREKQLLHVEATALKEGFSPVSAPGGT